MRLSEIKQVHEGEVIKGNFQQHGKVLLAHRRDEGEEWKFWTGVNWFGTKARARAVQRADVQALLDRWGFSEKRTWAGEVKLVPAINEEALETFTAEDLWSENADSAAWYISNTQYLVRPIKDTSPVKYEAFAIEGSTKMPFGKFTADELKNTLEPIRSGQKPDAEGFTTYVDPNKVQAFQYQGDPVKVLLGKEGGARLSAGDYLVRSNDGNNFMYAVDRAAAFEATLTKVKK